MLRIELHIDIHVAGGFEEQAKSRNLGIVTVENDVLVRMGVIGPDSHNNNVHKVLEQYQVHAFSINS